MHIEMLSIGRGNPNLREWNESREEQPANLHLLSAGKGSRENHVDISNSFLIEEWELRTNCVVSLLAESGVTYKCYSRCIFLTASQFK